MRSGTGNRDGALPVAVVPTLGLVAAAIAVLGPILALRHGASELAIWLATAGGGLATLGFAARRHGVIGRAVGGPVTALSSAITVLATGYAVAVDTGPSIVVSGTGWSVPIVLGSFFAAAVATSLAVADYGGVSASGLGRRAAALLELLVVSFLGFALYVTVVIVLQSVAVSIAGDLSTLQMRTINYVGLGAGFGAAAVGYLSVRERELSYLDFEVPSGRAILWIVGGVVAIYGANVLLGSLLTAVGLEPASHGTVAGAQENADLLLVIVPATLLIVAPAEELLFRNIVQKTLYETFSRPGAVVVASVIFAGIHLPAYGTSGPGAILVSFLLTFALSLVLGTVYERTDNLVVPVVVHGLYNVGVFVSAVL